jgi:hypothetical protein
VRIWLAIKPPMIATPSGWRSSPPSPKPSANGTAPSTAATVAVNAIVPLPCGDTMTDIGPSVGAAKGPTTQPAAVQLPCAISTPVAPVTFTNAPLAPPMNDTPLSASVTGWPRGALIM